MTQDKSGREARLKLALRDNLRKRKAQERDSRDPDSAAGEVKETVDRREP